MDSRNIYEMQEGSIRNLKHIAPDQYWQNNKQLSHPATEDQIKTYLDAKNDKPSVFTKIIWLICGALVASYAAVHGVWSIIRMILQ